MTSLTVKINIRVRAFAMRVSTKRQSGKSATEAYLFQRCQRPNQSLQIRQLCSIKSISSKQLKLKVQQSLELIVQQLSKIETYLLANFNLTKSYKATILNYLSQTITSMNKIMGLMLLMTMTFERRCLEAPVAISSLLQNKKKRNRKMIDFKIYQCQQTVS